MRLSGVKCSYDHKIPGERKREKKRAKILRFKGGLLEGAYALLILYKAFGEIERGKEGIQIHAIYGVVDAKNKYYSL